MAQQGVHYFPGHMQKALRALENYIKKNYLKAIQAPKNKKAKLVTWLQMI